MTTLNNKDLVRGKKLDALKYKSLCHSDRANVIKIMDLAEYLDCEADRPVVVKKNACPACTIRHLDPIT